MTAPLQSLFTKQWRAARTQSLRIDRVGSMTVHVASTFRSRFIGLLGRGQLDEREGMLFIPGGSIHTLGMRFAIDVVFLDAQLRVLRIAPSIRPWRFVRAPRTTHYVMEIRAGAAKRRGLDEGDVLSISHE